MPDAAIFADTGAEPAAVYENLAWLMQTLPFPVHIAQWRNLRDDILATARGEAVGNREKGFLSPPMKTRNADGSAGLLKRDCTSEYKIKPIERKLKELLGLDPDKPVRLRKGQGPLARQWVGISHDEWIREKPSGRKWYERHHPLLEKRLTRGHCLEWMADNGYPTPPSSACTFCPFRGDAEWRNLQRNQDDWLDAVAIDEVIRDLPDKGVASLKPGGRVYLHRNLEPLSEVDLTDPHKDQVSLWGEECAGVCGV